jgi:hypothetical protein
MGGPPLRGSSPGRKYVPHTLFCTIGSTAPWTLRAPHSTSQVMRPNLLSRRRKAECSVQANGHDALRNVRMAPVRADGSEQALVHAVDSRESPTRFV